MRRRAFLIAFVVVSVFVAGWLVGRGRGQPTPPADPEPVEEVTISWPDPAEPDGLRAVRFKVAHSGTHLTGTGTQKADEFGVTLWSNTGKERPPMRYVAYFGPVVTADR